MDPLNRHSRQPCPSSNRPKRRQSQPVRRLLSGTSLALLAGITAANTDLTGDLTDMSLEALMDIEVTSVTKRPQRQADAAAAIYVITNEDLRRWGVGNIPDALRRVPGIEVARIDANKWAITSRGFNSRFANKLLVLIDGRSVYTPLFAGVYWDTQDVILEDVDRIEVIRGPGGTLWGANAVNGVINIITRSATETQGNMVAVAAGDELRSSGSARHGGKLKNGADYRVYAKYSDHDEGYNKAGAHDDWRSGQVGFRSDWDQSGNDSLTLQGDYYRGKAGQQVTIPVGSGVPLDPTRTIQDIDDTRLDGGNLQMRWSRMLGDSESLTLQLYYDYVSRNGVVLDETRNTIDMEIQHRFPWRQTHDLVWGFDYRYINDDSDNNPTFSLHPSSRSTHLFSTFIQDEISLAEDLRLTVGSKFEHNDYSGFEYQPNLRMAWSLDDTRTLWGAVSRAVRTPARGEHDVLLRLVPSPAADPGVPVFAAGNNDYESESMIAWELGYRMNRNNRWSLDIAAFYNDYDSLRTMDSTAVPTVLHFDNNLQGETHGLEIAGQWQLRPGWNLHASASWLDMSLRLQDGSSDSFSASIEDASPKTKAAIWSAIDFGRQLELDAALRYSGGVKVNGFDIDSYVELDLRLGWKAAPGVELALVGQNLLDSQQREFLPDFINSQPTELERSFYGKLTWNF